MKIQLSFLGKVVKVDLEQGADLSLPIRGDGNNPTAWYMDPPTMQPVIMGDFVGSVESGKSSTNFRNIAYNPHAHGTHTECLGHITKEVYSVNKALSSYFFTAVVISITPQLQLNGDWVITSELLHAAIQPYQQGVQAIIIRTMPNGEDKKTKAYSHTNPPYLDAYATELLVERGVQHLLIDLPSVDKEKDEGKLAAHKAFWNVSDVTNPGPNARYQATITEMIFVPEEVQDGYYFLNLQTAPFENDATPSRPVVYAIE